jgi:hypothetical protein
MTLRLDRTIVALALVALCGPVLAQQPTQEQINAIRSNCRSDFLSNCSGVPRGGPEAVRCLKDHLAQLSPGCHAAVSAITPPAPKVAAPAPAAPAAAPAEPPAAGPAATATPAAPPAAPAAQPSTATAPAAPALATNKKAPPPRKTAQPAAPIAPAAPPPVTQPTSLGPIPPLRPALRLMIVRACRIETRTVCGMLPAGGGRIVECLAEHGASLSPGCRDAILSVK